MKILKLFKSENENLKGISPQDLNRYVSIFDQIKIGKFIPISSEDRNFFSKLKVRKEILDIISPLQQKITPSSSKPQIDLKKIETSKDVKPIVPSVSNQNIPPSIPNQNIPPSISQPQINLQKPVSIPISKFLRISSQINRYGTKEKIVEFKVKSNFQQLEFFPCTLR